MLTPFRLGLGPVGGDGVGGEVLLVPLRRRMGQRLLPRTALSRPLRQPQIKPVRVPFRQCLRRVRHLAKRRLQEPRQPQGGSGQSVTRQEKCLVHDRISGDAPEAGVEALSHPLRHRAKPRAVAQRRVQDVMGGQPLLLMREEGIEGWAVVDGVAGGLGGQGLFPVPMRAPEGEGCDGGVRLGQGPQGTACTG